MNAQPRALAEAAERLRGKPGRPRKTAPPVCSGPAQLGARLLDVPAAAAHLGLSTWTVRDLIAAGRLPRVRIGELRVVRVDRVDLDRFIEAWKERG